MTMTTAPETGTVSAQQIRDLLLQATDAHSNISNMVAVLDVISILEKYPITKEALEETRLGKLINDLRKKTRDEDLARRAKKLLRNWQKLIDPQQPEVLTKELSSTLSSVVGSNWPRSMPASRAPQTATENDKKPVLQTVHSSSTETISCMKTQEKVEKTSLTLKDTQRPALPLGSGSSGGPEAPQIHAGAIKPPISSELNKEPTASTIFRKPILQQQGQRDASENVKHKAHGHYANPSPRSLKQLSKQPTSFSAPDPEPLSALPLVTSIQGTPHTESPRPKDPSHPDYDSLLTSERTLEQTNNLQNKSKEPARLQPGLLSEVTNVGTEKEARLSDGKRRKPPLRDGTDGRLSDDVCKPVRVKNRKLTFDPLTQQIRPSVAHQGEEQPSAAGDVNEAAKPKQSSPAPSPAALHKMNWKDMSQNEIVKYYLNLQNNLLKTSSSQVPGVHFLMTDYMKHEEDRTTDGNRTYVRVANVSETSLPGIDRDITTEDVCKINNKPWPGVNGCYDSEGRWYGWTECISLDTYGHGSKLNILPYVCTD